MKDKFYEACEKHSARRCMLCQRDRPVPVAPAPLPAEPPRRLVQDDPLATLPDGVFSPEPPFEIPAVRPDTERDLVFEIGLTSDTSVLAYATKGQPKDSHQLAVSSAAIRYINAYSQYENAKQAVIDVEASIARTKQESLDALAIREAARNELFDLISQEDSKAA